MKKVCILLAVLLLCLVPFAACAGSEGTPGGSYTDEGTPPGETPTDETNPDDTPPEPEHPHTFLSRSDRIYHWQECECGETGEKIMHVYSGDVCEVCGADIVPSENLAFELNEDGDGYIVYGGTCTDTQIVIPAAYNGLPVTEIGSEAFGDRYSFSEALHFTDVAMPTTLNTIGFAAFSYCEYLQSVRIPEGVNFIDSKAFQYCTSLVSVYMPDSVMILGYPPFACDVFAYCKSLTTVRLSANLIELGVAGSVGDIGGGIFSDCSNLTFIDIPDKVGLIGWATFSETPIESIVLPASLHTIYQADLEPTDAIYYKGTEEQLLQIEVIYGDLFRYDPAVYYYSETAPAQEGNYWHYVDGKPAVWE